MEEYISRESVLNFQNDLDPCICRSSYNDEMFSATKDADLVRFICSIPAADVVKRKTGRWRTTDAFPHWLYCDQCSKRIVPNVNWIEEYNIPTNFCPNCGADMREV